MVTGAISVVTRGRQRASEIDIFSQLALDIFQFVAYLWAQRYEVMLILLRGYKEGSDKFAIENTLLKE